MEDVLSSTTAKDWREGRRLQALELRQIGIRYHPAHVSRLVRALGQSVQKPIERATQRDEAAVAQWYGERWPALKKEAG
jgi:transposase